MMKKKHVLLCVLLLAGKFLFAQYISPKSKYVTVRNGEYKTVSFTLFNPTSTDFNWYLSGAAGASISKTSGRLFRYGSDSFSITVNNVANATYTTTYHFGINFSSKSGNHYDAGFLTVAYVKGCVNEVTLKHTVSAGRKDYQSAIVAINAQNTIENGAEAYYSAGTRVRLIPGFKALSGAKFKAFIQGCSARTAQETNEKELPVAVEMNVESDKMSSRFEVYPNPFTNKITIQTRKEIVVWKLRTLYGTTVASGREKDVLTTELPKGMYLLQIALASGEIVTKKVIKE